MISKEELEKWAFQLNMDGDCDATDKDIETLITQALDTMEELETAKRCLPVDKEFEVRGSWIGSVQNYIAHLEESLEREVAIREQNLAIKLCMNARITELESFHTAYMEWSDKTAWVQTDKRFDVLKPWGRHRADVLKEYIEYLENRIATDSEPVAVCIVEDGQMCPDGFGECDHSLPDGTHELYAAPQPSPVVPDEVTTEYCPAFVKYDITEVDEAWVRGFNACRVAMLNGGKL